MSGCDDVLAALDADSARTLDDLMAFARIPGVSADGFDPGEVARSAHHAAGLLAGAGLENCEVLNLAGAHPYVVGDWLHAGNNAPTVLVYAHHDVQPPGRPERWVTPAFEPTLRDDGRLYGRGVVDDKAGLLLHLAAVRAWLTVRGHLPVNLKMIVEGEEEIGSPHLASFLEQQRVRLAADVIVLSDTANLDTGIPSITTSLRGLVSIDVSVRALDHPVHSGMWGGPVLDAATALSRILSRLVNDEGRIAVPGLSDDVPLTTPQRAAELAKLPFDEEAFRDDVGVVNSARLGGDVELPVLDRVWRQPAIAVVAIDAPRLADAANQLVDEVAARVSVRVAPGQDPERVCERVLHALRDAPPWGVEVECTAEAPVPGWSIEARGPSFDAARRALEAGFGCPAVEIGCGGTIPFVGPFSQVMGGVPALLLGLEDPICNAHGENESLCLDDFGKACAASVHLLHELGQLTHLHL